MSEALLTPKPLKLLIDTNVWLDNYLGFRQGHDDARQMLLLAYKKGCTLLYPTACAKDVYYLIVQSLKHLERKEHGELTDSESKAIDELAWGCVTNMREVATAVGMDQSDLWMAAKLRPLIGDLEDALVLASGMRVDADYLVTSDKKLLSKAAVATLTVEDMTRLLQALSL